MSSWGRVGSTRFRRRRRFGGRRGGGRRKLTWRPLVFSPNLVAAGNILEFVMSSEADLLDRSLARGTIGPIYGRISIAVDFPEAIEDVAYGAWGIRLKEADAAASSTVFSPLTDGDSTDWITWRGFSIVKAGGNAVITDEMGGVGNETFDFVIRNPRRLNPDDELVMLFENSSASEAVVLVNFWCRTGILLP